MSNPIDIYTRHDSNDLRLVVWRQEGKPIFGGDELLYQSTHTVHQILLIEGFRKTLYLCPDMIQRLVGE